MKKITGKDFIIEVDKLLGNADNLKRYPILQDLYIDTNSDYRIKAKIGIKNQQADKYGIIDRYFFIELNKEYTYDDKIIIYFLFERNRNKNMYNQSVVIIKNEENDIFLDILGTIL